MYIGYAVIEYSNFNYYATSYKEARTELEMVFGSKMHKEFPRKYLESESCGEGFWPSTGDGRYEHEGVDVEAMEGELVINNMTKYNK